MPLSRPRIDRWLRLPRRIVVLRLAVAHSMLVLLTGSAGCQTWTRARQALSRNDTSASDLPGARLSNDGQYADAPPPGSQYEEQEDVWDRASRNMDSKALTRNFKKLIGLGADEAAAQRSYDEGEQLFQQQQYAEALKCYRQAALRWPDSALEEDALFKKGECYFFLDKYSKASDTYAALMKKYENCRYLDIISNRHYAIGQYWEQLAQRHSGWVPNLADGRRPMFDMTGNALSCYKSVWLNDPRGPLADDAVLAEANNYFRRERFYEASKQYDMLRKEYPQSEHQLKAHLLGLQSHVQSYEGPQYDGSPLAQAEELADQTMTQFPGQLGDERQRVVEAKNWTHVQKAQRDWEAAEYYFRTKYYRAARYYYDLVIRDYPDTPYADMSRQRMEETQDFPSHPPNHFAWLTNLFPESKKL